MGAPRGEVELRDAFEEVRVRVGVRDRVRVRVRVRDKVRVRVRVSARVRVGVMASAHSRAATRILNLTSHFP